MTKKRLFSVLAAVLFGISAVWAIIDTPILYATLYAESSIRPQDGLNWIDWVYAIVFLSLTVLFIVQAIKNKLSIWIFIIPLSFVIILRFYAFFATVNTYVNTIETIKKHLADKAMMEYSINIAVNLTISILQISATVLLLLLLIFKKKFRKLFFIPAAVYVLCVILQICIVLLDVAIMGSASWKGIGKYIFLICFYSISYLLQAASYLFFAWALVKDDTAQLCVEKNLCEEVYAEKPAQAEPEDIEAAQVEPIVSQGLAMGVADELKKYKELLDCGAISQEEYESAKKRLLKM